MGRKLLIWLTVVEIPLGAFMLVVASTAWSASIAAGIVATAVTLATVGMVAFMLVDEWKHPDA